MIKASQAKQLTKLVDHHKQLQRLLREEYELFDVMVTKRAQEGHSSMEWIPSRKTKENKMFTENTLQSMIDSFISNEFTVTKNPEDNIFTISWT